MAEALWNDIVYTDVLQSDGFTSLFNMETGKR